MFFKFFCTFFSTHPHILVNYFIFCAYLAFIPVFLEITKFYKSLTSTNELKNNCSHINNKSPLLLLWALYPTN